MSPRLNGKFVSKEKYETALADGEVSITHTGEAPVTDAPAKTRKPRKPREADPITAATARARAAKKELDRVKKLHEKRAALPSLEHAQAEYDNAAQALRAALGV